MFEANSKVLDNVETSLSSWGSARIDQQVCKKVFPLVIVLAIEIFTNNMFDSFSRK